MLKISKVRTLIQNKRCVRRRRRNIYNRIGFAEDKEFTVNPSEEYKKIFFKDGMSFSFILLTLYGEISISHF